MKASLSATCLLGALLANDAAIAEISTDGSLGPALDLSGPAFSVPDSLGSRLGANLFHSFARFNLASGESATFSGPGGIGNIIARVTGGSPSSIDGLLRSTIPGANLFFLNPYGLMFGPDARIDVSGGFHASTAHYLALSDGGRFDALHPDASTLSVDPPSAFGFGTGPVMPIQVDGSVLQAADGQALSLTGGDITVDNAVLATAGGHLGIAGLASAGTVPLDIQGLAPGDFAAFADVTLRDSSGAPRLVGTTFLRNLDISGPGGGEVLIRGGNLYVSNAKVFSQNDGAPSGGGIDVHMAGTAAISGNAQLTTRSEGPGRAGNVRIKADTITLSDFATVSSDTNFTTSDPGVAVEGGGTVTVSARRVAMTGNSELSANTLGDGAGGNVAVTADSLALDTTASIRTLTAFACEQAGCSKDAGSISISAGDIRMVDNATVDTSSFFNSEGRAGQIGINADSLTMDGNAWFISNTFTEADAGHIDMQVKHLDMRGQSVISTSTFTGGLGGDVSIAGNSLAMGGDAIITSGTEGPGAAGTVTIGMDQVTLGERARISSEAEGSNAFVRGGADLSGAAGGGRGGNIIVNMADALLSGDAEITASTAGIGDAGSISISGRTLTIRDGARVSALSSGTGKAGSVIIDLSDYLALYNGLISVQTQTADAGDIRITAGQLVHLVNSVISTSAADGLGNGGNVAIDPVFVVLNNSQIVARASQGSGGNITIVTNNYIKDDASTVDASSEFGLDGTVSIESPGDQANTAPEETQAGFAAVVELATNRCESKTRGDISSLVVAARDGLPASPDQMLSAELTPNARGLSGISGPALDKPDALYAIVCLR